MSNTDAASRRDLLLVFFVAAALAFSFLGSRPFSTRGEPREAIVAQAMLNTDNWLLGSGYGGAVPSKPPFMHWFIAAFSEVAGGVSEWTARLPNAIVSVLFAVLWFRFIRRHMERESALLGTLILVTTFEWYRTATGARVDMFLTALTGFAFIGMYEWWERRFEGFPVVAAIALTGAALSKGPVGIALPLVLFGVFLYVRGESPVRIVGKCGLLVVLPVLITAGWYVAAYIQRGHEFFLKVYYENISRLAGTQEDQPHKNSAFYLYGMLILGFLPWVLVSFPVIPRFIRFLKIGPKGWAAWFKEVPAFVQFGFLAAAVFIIFYSIPAGKRGVYLLPIYPFLAAGLGSALIASRYNELLSTRIVVRLAVGIFAVIGLFILVFSGLLTMAGPGLSMEFGDGQGAAIQNLMAGLSSGELQTENILLYVVVSLLLLGAICTGGILKQKHDLAIYFTLLYVTISGSFVVHISRQLSAKPFAPIVAAKVPESKKLCSYQYAFYGLSFYLNREIDLMTESPGDCAYVLLQEEDLPGLANILTGTQRAVAVAQAPNAIDKLGKPVMLFEIRGTSAPPSAP